MKVSVAAGTAVVLSLSIVSSASAAINEWMKTSSGYWEEPYWSLGMLPSAEQEAVVFANPGWKALAIGTNTTAHHPASLLINNLTIDAPPDSANQLLLNWGQLSVPLVVRSRLFIGTNGSLVSHYSALQAADVDLRGWAAFSDFATASLDQITLRSSGALYLNDASLTSSNLAFWGGAVTQSMGVAVISWITALEQWTPPRIDNTYVLSNGLLVSGRADVGHYGLSGSDRFTFLQSGGVHSNGSMTLWGGQRRFQQISYAGHYSLSGGLLVSEEITVYAGGMEQSGGTNLTRELTIAGGGGYTLSGGRLVTSNMTVSTVDCLPLGFTQNGGSHTLQNRFALNNNARYSLWGGTLSAPLIEINIGAALGLLGGTVSNPGTVILRRGAIRVQVDGVPQQLGKLQVLDVQDYSCGPDPSAPATLYMTSTNGPAVLRFADSRDLAWDGTLHILNWSTNHAGNGPDRIFVGASSQALTLDQLRRVVFIRPSGLPSDYAAMITAAGELVPGALHDYDYVITNGTIIVTHYTGSGGNVTIPTRIENLPVTSIGNRAFAFVTSITSITIPNTVTNIGDEAFHYCIGLTNVTIAEGVIRIGNGAFKQCSGLLRIAIPASVRDIGERIVEQCENLNAIIVAAGNLIYSSIDGVLFNKSRTELIQFPERKVGNYVLPDTVTSIGDYAFWACYGLTNVILSASVTNIGASAFEFCTSLSNIALHEGLRTIGDFAFFHSGLESVSLPDSLTSIGARSFEQCIGLRRVEIGRTIEKFGYTHFLAYCNNLVGVYFRGDVPEVLGDFENSFPTVYYLPGTVGWGATFAGRPTAPWFLPNPRILDFGPSFGVRTNRFGFVISWATNAQVVVEASTSLGNSHWSAVATNALTGGSFYFSDVQPPNSANRFYRLRVP